MWNLQSSANIYSLFGPVYNPQLILSDENHFENNDENMKERRVAGGSSGGSAAAVAAGMCLVWVDCCYLLNYIQDFNDVKI